ncbi:lytic transglycosylase domain-containing protein [Streptomyces sp. NBC_01142]|uniref:lytic transglycosylase domain-containing protein n=1 Tax=Streptomyces sp. NBC_01142 TaxID=2975865 RepID=UPI00225B6346|nr:lytic transglycosylase domain-containing protein [Streptomyces sp. NBC_01142]MCX4820610.1 lytic transglycosylase domain-containing protein [Streptomyces sp. NBC_01142]
MRPGGERMRRGLAGTVAAVAAMAALTASQAPGLVRAQPVRQHNTPSENGSWAEPRNDDSYHTELPPLRPSVGTGPSPSGVVQLGRIRAESGIPATVLAAYRGAETRIGRIDPGCRLPWHLLAAIGKVESGQARGGRVDANGTTLSPILGPVLNGVGFANIPDTDKGAYDGDTRYDRAVGPMQFIPSTWARWGQDANGDGRKDPHNIHDAALAAGLYLCADGRNLAVKADLDRAILSYNHSREYLRTVLAWLEFYRKGTHPVPDGQGVLPTSPGAGGKTPATLPVGGGTGGGPGGGGDIIIGPRPSGSPSVPPTGGPSPSPGGSPSPDPGGSPGPSPGPGPSGSPGPGPGPSPDPSPDPSPSDSACPSPSPDPSPSDAPSAPGTQSPSPAPSGSPSDGPCSPSGS